MKANTFIELIWLAEVRERVYGSQGTAKFTKMTYARDQATKEADIIIDTKWNSKFFFALPIQ